MSNTKQTLTAFAAILMLFSPGTSALADELPQAPRRIVQNQRDFCTTMRMRYARCLAHMADSGMDRGGARDACWHFEPGQFGCR